ncbi:hypothetical protein GCM10025868_01000 [Angustibacter aerolatus]|uniref:ANTAR domain-containing protein n=1 Tax=Angustibacter aerolatus TaxID=1162965 RepID=A0ABQ6JDE0_9ACTN|nr:hypothetical protein GCM10025868_01000 [Angustibacter aerolatus]
MLIEQAKGALAARTGLEVDAAFQHMRGYARRSGGRLTDIARSVLDGDLDPAQARRRLTDRGSVER